MSAAPGRWTWLPEAAAAGVVLLVGALEVANRDPLLVDARLPLVLVVLAMATAVALARRLPGLALALVWLVGAVQVLAGVDLLLVQVAVAAVAFGTARWGSTPTLLLSLLSIPTGAVIAVAYVRIVGVGDLVHPAGLGALARNLYRLGDTWQVGAALVGMALLGLPWLAGLAFRFHDRAQASKISQVAAEQHAARADRERDQAEEIARLRDEQTRLARDVHDVVGHSLAVILAQAESAQYLPDDDPGRLQETMATIATSARTSLQDVRQVLTATQAAPARTAGLDSLVEGVRASGHEVVDTEVGTPQPLPPELEVVAYRVLQEMLTNAIRHGRRGSPVTVERHWEGELRLEVHNVVAGGPEGTSTEETRPLALPEPAPAGPGASPGQGLAGMRRRLESVGGRLDVRRREAPGGATFTATAWLPVGGAAR